VIVAFVRVATRLVSTRVTAEPRSDARVVLCCKPHSQRVSEPTLHTQHNNPLQLRMANDRPHVKQHKA
jgi:hypothetical protein